MDPYKVNTPRQAAIESGLEVVPQSDSDKMVAHSRADVEDPQYMPGRRSSEQPQVVEHPKPSPQSTENSVHAHYAEAESNGYYPHEKDPSQQPPVYEPVSGRKKRRRICGLSIIWFALLIILLVVIIVLAAVLGGVLGSRSNSKNTSNSASAPSSSNSTSNTTTAATPNLLNGLPNAIKNTGMASLGLLFTSDPLYIYQGENGTLYETFYNDNFWTSSDNPVKNQSVINVDADKGSPLALSQWIDSGSQVPIYQILFSHDGYLTQANKSAYATLWGQPARLSNTKLAAGTPAVDTCVDEVNLNGIRTYFGGADGHIHEIGYDFGTKIWSDANLYFNPSDAHSGVSCSIQIGAGSSWLNLYMRNTTSGNIQQAYYTFGHNTTGSWTWGGESAKGVMPGSAIKAIYDGSGTPQGVGGIDFVYFQSADNGNPLIRGETTPHNATAPWNNWYSLGSAMNATAISAAYTSSGPFDFYQGQNGTIYSTSFTSDGSTNSNNSMIG